MTKFFLVVVANIIDNHKDFSALTLNRMTVMVNVCPSVCGDSVRVLQSCHGLREGVGGRAERSPRPTGRFGWDAGTCQAQAGPSRDSRDGLWRLRPGRSSRQRNVILRNGKP